MHGGAAPRVKANREKRVLAGELALQGVQVDPRHPSEALFAAAQDADVIVQRLKHQIVNDGELSATALGALGEWLDRVGRLAKTVTDGKVGEAIAERQHQIVDSQGQTLVAVLSHALAAGRLTTPQLAEVTAALPDLLRQAQDGTLPPMHPSQVPTYDPEPERTPLALTAESSAIPLPPGLGE